MIEYFKSLVASNSSGKASNSKFWYAVTMTTCTGIIIWYGYKIQIPEWMYISYLAAGGVVSVASKAIANKQQETPTT